MKSFALDGNSPCLDCEYREACEVFTEHMTAAGYQKKECLRLWNERRERNKHRAG